jgi:hypothetical protein
VYDPGRRYQMAMSTPAEDPHASDAMVGPHGTGDHGDDHGHDDHAHGGEEALGPLDPWAWGAGLIGIGAGLIVAICLVIGAGWVG